LRFLEHETALAGGLGPRSASRAKLSRDPHVGKEMLAGSISGGQVKFGEQRLKAAR
jgi:hypothetical protein